MANSQTLFNVPSFRDTPTSSGPNSFGKTKQGFTDTVKLWDKDPVKVAQILAEKAEKEQKSG